jgi:hypothetical protein
MKLSGCLVEAIALAKGGLVKQQPRHEGPRSPHASGTAADDKPLQHFTTSFLLLKSVA